MAVADKLVVVVVAALVFTSVFRRGLGDTIWQPLKPWLVSATVAGVLLCLLPRGQFKYRPLLGLVLVLMSFAVVIGAGEKSYVDATVGRTKHEYIVFGFPYRTEVYPSNLSRAYEWLLGREPPEPAWYFDWETITGPFILSHGDAFTTGLGVSAEALWDQIVRTDLPTQMAREMIVYYSQVIPPEGLRGRDAVTYKECYGTALSNYMFAYEYATPEERAALPELDDYVKEWLSKNVRLPGESE